MFRWNLIGWGLLMAILMACGDDNEPPKATAPISVNLEPSATPNLPARANADWTPVIETFDTVEMVRVPSGCFVMGNDLANPDEAPAHEVCIMQDFWLDRYEVSNAQFAAFGGEANRTNPFLEADYPRLALNWAEAAAYCERRGGRLPTEAEWEYAAAGPDNLRFTWGNNFDRTRAIIGGRSGNEPAPIGERSIGASWVGAQDMVGNALEWTSSRYNSYPFGQSARNDPRYVARGGAYDLLTEDVLRIDYRHPHELSDANPRLGVRCARDVDG